MRGTHEKSTLYDRKPGHGCRRPCSVSRRVAGKVNGVRILLKWECRDPDENKDPQARLIRMGAGAFPAYEDILNDPKATPTEVSRILYLVCKVKADRRRFLVHALQRLADSSKSVRRDAVQLLAEIGTSADASPGPSFRTRMSRSFVLRPGRSPQLVASAK
jgi:hypothetical protein